MNGEWSLRDFYEGYQSESYKKDAEAAAQIVREMNAFADSLSERKLSENLRGMTELYERASDIFERLSVYSVLRQAANTADGESASALGRVLALEGDCARARALMERYAAEANGLEKAVKTDNFLKDYEYFFRSVKKDGSHILDASAEEAVSKYSLSGSIAWSDMWGFLTSSATVELEGRELGLTELRSLAYDADAKVRQKAFESELACCEKVKDACAFALNSIKLQSVSECELRGFASPLSQTVYSSRMKEETLEALTGALEEYLPEFWRYLAAKGRSLGSDSGIKWQDLFAPMGKNDRKYSASEAKDYLLDIFSRFSPQLEHMTARAFDDEWIDWYPRKNKTGGAFCESAMCLEQFRILTNFTGSFSDIVTLAHELGHGYHSIMVQENRALNREYPMPLAETASTFNENVVMNSAIASAGEESVKLALLDGMLSDAAQITCDIYSRFLFEKAVTENRKNSFMFAEELSQMMIEAQKKAYGSGLDFSSPHPYMWVVKCHYYQPGLDFYNFPYAFGGLLARGLYKRYREEGKTFLSEYDAFLKASAVMDIEDAALVCGIDVTGKSFWRKSLSSFTDDIDEFVRLTEKQGVRK